MKKMRCARCQTEVHVLLLSPSRMGWLCPNCHHFLTEQDRQTTKMATGVDSDLVGTVTVKRCSRCNCTVLRNAKGDEWCSFVGGRDEKPCTYGLDMPSPAEQWERTLNAETVIGILLKVTDVQLTESKEFKQMDLMSSVHALLNLSEKEVSALQKYSVTVRKLR